MSTGKKILVGILIVILLAGAGVIVFLNNLGNALDEDNAETVSLTIESGSGTGTIAKVLFDNYIIDNVNEFKLWSRLNGYDSQYKAGTYTLSPSMDYQTIADIIVGGKVNTKNFTIPEGYTIYQTAKALADQGFGNYDKFVELIEAGDFDYEFLGEAQDNKNKLEGYIMPNTYTVDEGMNEEQVINVMLRQFEKDAYVAYKEADKAGPAGKYSLNEIVTIASIIERECKVDEERPLVASVIYNRLDKGMALQMCSTVQYVLGKQKEVLTIADTKIESPYNTYINAGLPPGPIASPGMAAVKAALNPADTDYLYFVVSEKLDGTSNFSATYEKFLQDKAAYDRAYTAAN
ncbi:MAG: endolytic transglycosylase MltG [Firmicutes bacterium]|nr:endolytic transglycosylase MltG [Bacillota bacterium]